MKSEEHCRSFSTDAIKKFFFRKVETFIQLKLRYMTYPSMQTLGQSREKFPTAYKVIALAMHTWQVYELPFLLFP